MASFDYVVRVFGNNITIVTTTNPSTAFEFRASLASVLGVPLTAVSIAQITSLATGEVLYFTPFDPINLLGGAALVPTQTALPSLIVASPAAGSRLPSFLPVSPNGGTVLPSLIASSPGAGTLLPSQIVAAQAGGTPMTGGRVLQGAIAASDEFNGVLIRARVTLPAGTNAETVAQLREVLSGTAPDVLLNDFLSSVGGQVSPVTNTDGIAQSSPAAGAVASSLALTPSYIAIAVAILLGCIVVALAAVYISRRRISAAERAAMLVAGSTPRDGSESSRDEENDEGGSDASDDQVLANEATAAMPDEQRRYDHLVVPDGAFDASHGPTSPLWVGVPNAAALSAQDTTSTATSSVAPGRDAIARFQVRRPMQQAADGSVRASVVSPDAVAAALRISRHSVAGAPPTSLRAMVNVPWNAVLQGHIAPGQVIGSMHTPVRNSPRAALSPTGLVRASPLPFSSGATPPAASGYNALDDVVAAAMGIDVTTTSTPGAPGVLSTPPTPTAMLYSPSSPYVQPARLAEYSAEHVQAAAPRRSIAGPALTVPVRDTPVAVNAAVVAASPAPLTLGLRGGHANNLPTFEQLQVDMEPAAVVAVEVHPSTTHSIDDKMVAPTTPAGDCRRSSVTSVTVHANNVVVPAPVSPSAACPTMPVDAALIQPLTRAQMLVADDSEDEVIDASLAAANAVAQAVDAPASADDAVDTLAPEFVAPGRLIRDDSEPALPAESAADASMSDASAALASPLLSEMSADTAPIITPVMLDVAGATDTAAEEKLAGSAAMSQCDGPASAVACEEQSGRETVAFPPMKADTEARSTKERSPVVPYTLTKSKFGKGAPSHHTTSKSTHITEASPKAVALRMARPGAGSTPPITLTAEASADGSGDGATRSLQAAEMATLTASPHLLAQSRSSSKKMTGEARVLDSEDAADTIGPLLSSLASAPGPARTVVPALSAAASWADRVQNASPSKRTADVLLHDLATGEETPEVRHDELHVDDGEAAVLEAALASEGVQRVDEDGSDDDEHARSSGDAAGLPPSLAAVMRARLAVVRGQSSSAVAASAASPPSETKFARLVRAATVTNASIRRKKVQVTVPQGPPGRFSAARASERKLMTGGSEAPLEPPSVTSPVRGLPRGTSFGAAARAALGMSKSATGAALRGAPSPSRRGVSVGALEGDAASLV